MRRNFIILGATLSALTIGLQTAYVTRDPQPIDPTVTVQQPGNTDQPRRFYKTPDKPSDKPAEDTPTAEVMVPIKKAAKRFPATPLRTVIIDDKEYPVYAYEPLMTPNDPNAGQWWVTNSRLNLAWDTPRGAHETTLAIIDTGFGLNHEEFAGRWAGNSGESGPTVSENPSTLNCTDRGLAIAANCNLIDDDGDAVVDNEIGTATYQNPSRRNCTALARPLDRSCNRIDDDANGLVDDVTGWDFINYDNSVQAGELNPTGTGTTHGTLVAGVAAATGNNGKGIAGVDWGTKILPLQALDDDSYGDTLSVGRAINYAVSRGVDVISLSLGSSGHDPYVQEAVRRATAAGILVVASSGNDGCDCVLYPANYPEVLAVGALNSSNVRASFSSYGKNLDMMAPGTSITTPTWNSTNQTSAYASSVNGTSFSAPLVSGMATRLLSQQPASTPMQLIAALTENTNRLTLPATPAHDLQYGYGTIDAHKATVRMSTSYQPSILYAFYPISKGSRLDAPEHAEQTAGYRVYQCETGTVGATPLYNINKPGDHYFTINSTEYSHALAAGYNPTLFSGMCLQLPHDTATHIRDINLYREFRNVYKPL